MAEENHLTYFKVQNFKRFKELEVKDIGQFNLVLGDNNVGKTSFLEALLFDDTEVSKTSILRLLRAFHFRGFGPLSSKNFLKYITRVDDYFESASNKIKFFFEEEGPISQRTVAFDPRVDSSNIKVFNVEGSEKHGFSKDKNIIEDLAGIVKDSVFLPDLIPAAENAQIPFIPFTINYNEFLNKFYGEFLSKDKIAKAKFFKSLNGLFDDIERLELSSGYFDNTLTLDVERKNERYSVPLAFYGEGLIKLVNVLSIISYYGKKRVMIDEIDTGIHYSRMKDFWKTILLAARENDVQLFATTHNLECIRYFKEALEEVDLVSSQKDARSITLVENSKTKDITAHTFSFEALEHSIDAGNEIRSF